jgi:glycerate-2-kinase
MKAGRMVQYAQPATMITLTLNTAPPDMPWPDLCLPDNTTFADAISVLDECHIWDKTPHRIREYLKLGLSHPELETPKNLDGLNQDLFNLASPQTACRSAARKAKELGFTPFILSTTFAGEAKELGGFMADIANEATRLDSALPKPFALISGGETTVRITEKCGKGGPNQESVIGFALRFLGAKSVVFASIDTDGTDGPCEIAGGIADASTIQRAKDMGLNLEKMLNAHDSYYALKTLQDEIETGHTGTNVMNLRVLLVR